MAWPNQKANLFNSIIISILIFGSIISHYLNITSCLPKFHLIYRLKNHSNLVNTTKCEQLFAKVLGSYPQTREMPNHGDLIFSGNIPVVLNLLR